MCLYNAEDEEDFEMTSDERCAFTCMYPIVYIVTVASWIAWFPYQFLIVVGKVVFYIFGVLRTTCGMVYGALAWVLEKLWRYLLVVWWFVSCSACTTRNVAASVSGSDKSAKTVDSLKSAKTVDSLESVKTVDSLKSVKIDIV
jgi:hypothetical protein